MTIISKIILTLQRVNGDSPPPSQIFHHLVHNFHNLYNLHFPTLKKNLIRKKYRSHASHAWVPTKEAQLPNSTIFSRFILSSTYLKWTTICPVNEYEMLAWVWASISKHVGLTIFIIFPKLRFVYSLSGPFTWRKITSRKEYRDCAGVRTIILKIFSVYR